MSFTCGNVYSCILWSKSISVQKFFHQKSTKRFGKGNGWMNWWLVYVPDVLDWKLDKALMDSKLLFWDISIRSMSKTNYQFGSRLYLRKQKKCIFRLFDQNNKHEDFFHEPKTQNFHYQHIGKCWCQTIWCLQVYKYLQNPCTAKFLWLVDPNLRWGMESCRDGLHQIFKPPNIHRLMNYERCKLISLSPFFSVSSVLELQSGEVPWFSDLKCRAGVFSEMSKLFLSSWIYAAICEDSR